MLTRIGCARPGATLGELLVALTLAAIVLGAATSVLLRQQRSGWELAGAADGDSQLRAATGALAAELSSLAAASGDLVAGEARDTALELRAFVAAGVACDDAAGSALLSTDVEEPTDASSAAEARVGDTLWWYAEPQQGWGSRRIVASDRVVLPCPFAGPSARPSRRLTVGGADTIRQGVPLRITRPVRYSFYRSGDGSLQLGLREWVEPAARFAPPQPIAGPLLPQVGGDRAGFRYFDADGTEVPVGEDGVDAARVARVRVVVLTRAHASVAGRDGVRRDSVDIALQPAGGP